MLLVVTWLSKEIREKPALSGHVLGRQKLSAFIQLVWKSYRGKEIRCRSISEQMFCTMIRIIFWFSLRFVILGNYRKSNKHQHMLAIIRLDMLSNVTFQSLLFSLSLISRSWIQLIPAFFLKALMRPDVLASWPETSPELSSSAWIFLARDLPSSTPHWSKELMFQMAPSVKVMCS